MLAVALKVLSICRLFLRAMYVNRPNAVVFSEPKNTERVRALFAHFLTLPSSAAGASESAVSEEEIEVGT